MNKKKIILLGFYKKIALNLVENKTTSKHQLLY